MRIENLPGDSGKRQKPIRVGRGEGSGKGKTSGRGMKGFQSRSGSNRRLGDEGGQMPLIQRIPKRGFKPLNRREYCPVNLQQLERFEANATVDRDSLYAARLIRKKNLPVKILANGELTKPLKVCVDAYSEAARKKIVDAGGSCEVFKPEQGK